MAMTKARLWVIGTAVLSVLLVVAAYFLVLAPKRAEAADLRQQTEDTQFSNDLLQARVAQLRADFADLPLRQAELAAIQQAMPEDAALPTLVRDLDRLASSAGVTLLTVAPGEGVAVPTAVAPAAAEAAPADAADGEAVEPAPVAPAAPTDLLVSFPLSIEVLGSFFEVEVFLKSVQADMPRAFLVENLNVVAMEPADAAGGRPATANGDVTMTLSGSVFALRQAAVEAPALPAQGATDAPAAPAPSTASADS
ncbi:hypothetical protein [Thalassiella azotivora]